MLLLLQNQLACYIETWHELLRTRARQKLYESWPWDDPDIFYDKVNLTRQ